MTRPFPNHLLQQRANALLSAWRSGDRLQLETALRQDSTIQDSFNEGDTAYSERDEMVEVAEEAIRVWLQSPTPNAELDLRVSLRLLKHLAGREFSSASA